MAPLPSWHACGSGVSNSAQWMSSGVGHSLGTGSGHILLLLELLCPWSVPEPLGWYTGMTEGSPYCPKPTSPLYLQPEPPKGARVLRMEARDCGIRDSLFYSYC